MESCFYDLDAPVERLCRKEVPVPYAKQMELHAIPQVKDIKETIQEMLS
jgi:pyruvate dehydrogenase E1 component beta subunit